MSVWKPKGSPFWHFDFWYSRERFHGSTGTANKREAQAVERQERDKAKLAAIEGRKAAVSVKLDHVAERYWQEIGRHHVGSATTERDIARIIGYFGRDKLLTEIADDDVTKLVAWRRGHRVKDHRKTMRPKDAPPLPFISNATVNRSTTEVLKKLFTRAKAWGIRLDSEPDWKKHWLKEPKERVRELHGDEGDRLDAATRDDYRPIMDFANASGLRLNECILRWSEVNWDAKLIVKDGKGDNRITVPITSVIREILWPLRGQHADFVFTYVAVRTKDKRVKGSRYPITYNGLKTQWKRGRKRSGVKDFRFHDKRHDFATKLLRDTGNLKLVQKALNHAKIETTLKYAHVMQDEVSAAVERVQKSRIKSRSAVRKVS
jgi:integrase